MKNRAAYMTELNKMEIREVPVPEPKEGEVLIRVEYVGICGSDVHYFHENRHRQILLPIIPAVMLLCNNSVFLLYKNMLRSNLLLCCKSRIIR